VGLAVVGLAIVGLAVVGLAVDRLAWFIDVTVNQQLSIIKSDNDSLGNIVIITASLR